MIENQNDIINKLNESVGLTSPTDEITESGPIIVKTDIDAKNGQDKCPKCGATDISLNVKNGKLRCNYCRFEFDQQKVGGFVENLNNLEGEVIASGATDISADAKDIITLKCSSCGAEVVIDTTESTQARCHWCRNTLSINQQIPNGSVPDIVLPFKLPKSEAQVAIENFVGKRKFFAHPKFKEEFTTQNIMGVYFPYMIVDSNSHMKLVGQGEHLVRSYTSNDTTYYDADLYNVEREFDIVIEGLTVESNSDKLNNTSKTKTNNIINSIMPFDVENSVKWNSNYLKGYTSEKRDVNIDQLKSIVEAQTKDVARYSANETLKNYNRGVRWETQDLEIKGQQWKSAYLPVWLYSYQQVKGDNKILHYVAVNARTKETMGSVPIHYPKLLLVSFLVEILGFILMLNIDFDNNWIFLASGFAYFFIEYSKYRNAGARHLHERETKQTKSNLVENDVYVKRLKGLRNSRMNGANNQSVTGSTVGNNNLTSKIVSKRKN